MKQLEYSRRSDSVVSIHYRKLLRMIVTRRFSSTRKPSDVNR
jgi:hypothetical protein